MTYRKCAYGSCEEPATWPEDNEKPVLCARHGELDKVQSKLDDWKAAGEYLEDFKSIAGRMYNLALHGALDDALATCEQTVEMYEEEVTKLSSPDVAKKAGQLCGLTAFGELMLEFTGHRPGEDTRELAEEVVRSAEGKAGREFGQGSADKVHTLMYSWGDVQLGSDLALAIARSLGLRDYDRNRMALAVTYDEYRPREAA